MVSKKEILKLLQESRSRRQVRQDHLAFLRAIEEAKKAGIKQGPSNFWKRLALKLMPGLKENSVLPTDHRMGPTQKVFCGTCQKSKPLFIEKDGLLVVNQ